MARPSSPMPPVPSVHDPKFYVVDGRHRLSAAIYRGAPHELRCDVISNAGHALRIIPVAELIVDPDVQLEFAYNDRWARSISLRWNERKAGVLTVVPMNGGGLTAAEKSEIKVGLDRERRHVKQIESFLLRLEGGDPVAHDIQESAKLHGFLIGKSGGHSHTTFECVSSIEKIYNKLQRRGLDRTFALCTLWKGDPKTNTAPWIEALSLLVRDGYDDKMTPAGFERLKDLVPATVIRRARGRIVAGGSLSADATGMTVSYETATLLRKTAKIRTLPVQKSVPTASKTRPI